MSQTPNDKNHRKSARRTDRASGGSAGWIWAAAIVLVVVGVFGVRYWQLQAASSSAGDAQVAVGANSASGDEPADPSTAQSSAPPLSDAPAPEPAPQGMVWVPGGTFWMGNNEYPDSVPEHLVEVDGFWMDEHEVTNAEFAKFVEATGYRTVAELPLDPKDFPTVPPEQLGGIKPSSVVFTPPPGPVPLDDHLQWWQMIEGADWRHPTGPDSSIEGLEDHPVVHIAWRDAKAYADWAGKRLPTEAEWEFAARGGLDRAEYCWGNSLRPGAQWQANIWQGRFPSQNTEDDGFHHTAPVGKFAANGYGLHDMSGNVWEWCADWYQPNYYDKSPKKNPPGPDSSFDPQEPGIPKRVQRGGSFMCADSYCRAYRPGARGKGDPSSAAGHIGFRCAKSAQPAK